MDVDSLIKKAEQELLTTFFKIDQQVKLHLQKIIPIQF